MTPTPDEQIAQELAEACIDAHCDGTLEAVAALILPLVQDRARLAYVYSGKRTTSNALVEIETRMLNGDVPTLDEVRAAIDRARSET